MKILIVDYDDTLLSFLTKKLEASGYEVVQIHFGTVHIPLPQSAKEIAQFRTSAHEDRPS